jgi:hypothetical protein
MSYWRNWKHCAFCGDWTRFEPNYGNADRAIACRKPECQRARRTANQKARRARSRIGVQDAGFTDPKV